MAQNENNTEVLEIIRRIVDLTKEQTTNIKGECFFIVENMFYYLFKTFLPEQIKRDHNQTLNWFMMKMV